MPENCPRLLIIDDHMGSLSLLMSFLEGYAMDVRIAQDGQDGLLKATKGMPDVILLDVKMPGMDGYTVCRHLKQDSRTADVPVIFLSGSHSLDDRLAGFAAGGVDYISKPFSAEEVLARIFVHLRWKQRLGQLELIAARETARDSPTATADPVLAAIAFLQHTREEWPGLAELARKVGTNEKRLTELFRQRFGMPVFEYMVELRLELARRLLESSDRLIKLIADQAGYSNSSAFTRAFRRRYGLGPKEYRLACSSRRRDDLESHAGTYRAPAAWLDEEAVDGL